MATKAEIRSDFIGRLFAVGVSIGFATAITRMDWVRTGESPSLGEIDQILILIAALIASLLNWDRYLVSMEAAPLSGFWRYAIDVILVFIYMFLLITSNNPSFFLPVLAIIFALYVVRDLLIVRQHVGGRYYGEQISSEDINRSPITTTSWAIYFGALAFLDRIENARHVPMMAAFAIAGLILYRLDKSHRPAGETAHGFRISTRISIIATLVILVLLVVYPRLANMPI